MDQILISAVYEKTRTRTVQWRDLSHPEDPAILELHHKAQLQRQVNYKGETRMLSANADYRIWYTPLKRRNLATNLIIIENENFNCTDTHKNVWL